MTPAATPLRSPGDEPGGRAWALPVLTLALKSLGQRVLLWLVTLGAGAIWTITVLHPDPWRIVAAMLYSLTVLIPFLWRDLRGGP